MFKNEDDFKKIIAQLNIDANPKDEHRENLRANMLSAFRDTREQNTRPASQWPVLWRQIMRSSITKLAAAAVITLAVLIGIHLLDKSATPAWANTIEQIYKATSVTFKETFYVNDNQPFTTEEMVNENGIKRSFCNGICTIFDFSGGKTLQLNPLNKNATLTYRTGEKRSIKPYNQLEWFISIKDRTEEYLGIEDINGISAEKFLWKNGEYYYTTVWIDPLTSLPIKVEQVSLPNPDKSIVQPSISLKYSDFGGSANEGGGISIGGGKGIQTKLIVVMTDFVWNKQLAPALFSLEPPEGYTLREKQFDASQPGENDLINTLSFWTEMSGGSFPESINDLVDPNQINPMLIKKFDRDGEPLEEYDMAMKQANIILKGIYFAFEKKADGVWGYTDKKGQLGDSDLPVCWWKQEDTNDYRVIFGDLSIATVPVGELPK